MRFTFDVGYLIFKEAVAEALSIKAFNITNITRHEDKFYVTHSINSLYSNVDLVDVADIVEILETAMQYTKEVTDNAR